MNQRITPFSGTSHCLLSVLLCAPLLIGAQTDATKRSKPSNKTRPSVSAPVSNAAAATLPPKRYALRGKITALHRQIKTLEVEHETIADYMEPMTMKFPVKDAKLFDHHKVGDLIEATLFVSQTSGDWWLANVRRAKPVRHR